MRWLSALACVAIAPAVMAQTGNVAFVSTTPTANASCSPARLVIVRGTGMQWACADDDGNGTLTWVQRTNVDIDGDGTTEVNFMSSYGGASNRRVQTTVDSWDITGLTVADNFTGILQQLTWTGSASGGPRRSGAFFINRYGENGSGGATVSGTDIAVGAYSEHRGDGAITGPVYGAENACTAYDTGSMANCFGSQNTAQIVNTSPESASITNAIGAAGLARIYPGGEGTITNAYGTKGDALLTGKGSITTAYGAYGLAGADSSGDGTITTAIGGYFRAYDGASFGAVTNAYGVQIPNVTAGTTNNYGLYVGAASGGSGNNYSIYMSGGTCNLSAGILLADDIRGVADIRLDATGDSTQDWGISTTTMTHLGDTLGYFRSEGAVIVTADSDNDSSGFVFFDPDGDAVYENWFDETNGLGWEGATDDAYETTLTVTDPTADRTITLPDASGTVALVAGSSGDVLMNSGGALASAVTGTALDLDGNGTAGSADFDGNGTADELGSAVGNLKASRLFLPTVNGSTGVAHVGAIASAWAHAAKYGDPHYYLRPAVFDAYSEVFRGAPLESAFDYDGTSNPSQYENVKAVISGCVGGVCTGREFYICVDDQDWDGTIVDTDGDGTAEIEVNDVVVAGTSTTTAAGARSHRVTAIVAGTAPDCGTANARLTVVPNIDEAAELDSNSDGTIDQTTLHNLWWQMVHPGDAGSYLLGYRLMYGSRARDGNHGANLLNNGEMEHDGTLKGWTLSTGTATSRVFNTTPATSAAQCFDGNGTADCFSFATTTSGASISSADVVATPGETLILSGYIAAESGDDVGLACDSNSDGTYALESGSSIDVSGSYWDLNHRSFPGWFWHSYTIPSDCTSLKAWIAKGGTTTDYPTVDGFSLKRSSTWLNDSSNGTQTSFLINDPGARNIILTGDSWTRPDGNGADIIAGMEAAAQTRFGRDLSAQIFATGVSGYTTADVLTNFYALIEKYEPLYVVVNVCTNDVLTGVTQTNFIANQKTLAARIMAIGAIPIFVSCPPLVQDENADRNINSSDFGAATKFNTSHTYRDAQRAALLNWAP